MKKKFLVVILAAYTLTLVACGKTEQQTIAEVDTNPEAEDTLVEAETEKEIELEKPETTNDTVDIIVGSDVLPINEFETKNREFRLSALPELHIILPSSDIICTIEDGDTMHDRQYSVETTEGSGFYVRIYFDGKNDEYCPAKHEEWIDYGRYAVDYNWCQFAVKDYETETAIVVLFLMGDKERTDESKQLMEDYARINIEYVKEQVASWDQDYVPDVEENIIDDAEPSDSSDNDGLLECDIIPCGFYDLDGNKYVMVSTYDDDDSGECMLMFGRYDGADSPLDYYELENIEDDTYSATNWDKVSVTVTFSDGGMDLSGGTGELEEYNGHYALQ